MPWLGAGCGRVGILRPALPWVWELLNHIDLHKNPQAVKLTRGGSLAGDALLEGCAMLRLPGILTK